MAGRHVHDTSTCSSSASKRPVGSKQLTHVTPALAIPADFPPNSDVPPWATGSAAVAAISPATVGRPTVERQFTMATPASTPSSSGSTTWTSAKPVTGTEAGRVVRDCSSGLAKGLNKELTCSICLGLFKTPKMLPCLHTFCEECLKQIAIQSSKETVKRSGGPSHPFLAAEAVEPKGFVACPTCRTEHSLPTNGVDGFSTNFTIANLVELLSFHGDASTNKSSRDVHKCENGLDDNPAVSKCLDCDCYLCKNCTDTHKKQKMSRNHKVVLIAEIKSGEVKQLSQKRYCSEHDGEELKLYCRSCEKAICRDCTIVTHKQHSYTFIKDVAEELSQKLQNLSTKVTTKREQIHGVINHIHREKQKEEQKLATCKQEANKYFDDHIANLLERIKQLKQHRAVLLQELTDASSSHTKQLTLQEEEFQFSCTQISSALTFSQQLLSTASGTDLAMMNQQVSQQMQTLSQLPSAVEAVKNSPWSINLSKEDPLNSKVWPFLNADSIVVSNLGSSVLLGKNTFQVHLENVTHNLKDLNAKVEVNLSTKNDCPVVIKQSSNTSLSISFFISPPCPDQVVISVSVNGIDSSRCPLKLKCKNKMAVGTKVQELNTKRKGTIVQQGTIVHGARGSNPAQSWFNQQYQRTQHSYQHLNQLQYYVEVSWDADGTVEGLYTGQAAGYSYGYVGQATESVPLSSLTVLPK